MPAQAGQKQPYPRIPSDESASVRLSEPDRIIKTYPPDSLPAILPFVSSPTKQQAVAQLQPDPVPPAALGHLDQTVGEQTPQGSGIVYQANSSPPEVDALPRVFGSSEAPVLAGG